ncbi:MAG: hydrolase [Nitrosarchaeum sp.]|nr:hydrolase [Nitrosarchaeum sp.]MCV0398911.1 hydrolase [Nitrosarchaeum sp.]
MASDANKDELIEAQKQVIGILFEVVKRLQANNDLDEEYFQIVTIENKTNDDKKRIKEILDERKENSMIVGKLLASLET